MPNRLTRRRFLQSSAVLGAISFTSGRLSGDDKKPSANERLNVGVIGITNRGEGNIKDLSGTAADIVALCDVDEKRSEGVRGRFPKATFCTDFRKLIDQKGLDAVLIATPDHTHATATVAALKAGLHVYCEKPLTHTVHELCVVAELAAKQKRVTQMGTQIHAGSNYRRVVELVQSGAIGPVREVHVWCDRSWGGGDRPKTTDPVPAHLHWDLWLGPVPKRPYHHGGDTNEDATYHPYNWRRWWDFGGGTLADMACHHMDLSFWALKLRHPTKVAASGPKEPHPETAAHRLIVNYSFPARGDLPPVTLIWCDGGIRKEVKTEAAAKWGQGTLFIGEKGMLLADYSRHVLLPQKQFENFQPPKPSIPDSIGHHKEWVEACKAGGPTTCNFDYAGALTEAVLLGNVAYRLGKPIEWDAKNLRVTNEPGAERFLRKEYRKPWTL